jgi:exodeoxyribonuclease III
LLPRSSNSCYNLVMRIATWNCQTGFAAKWPHVEALEADVITVQEGGASTKAFVEGHDGWSCEWQVGRYRRGVAVLAKHPYAILETEKSEPCVLSTLVSGPDGRRFRFVGFWAMTPRRLDDSYPQQATDLIEWLPDDGLPTVIAGDFNASSRNAHHLANVNALSARGIVSAYHAIHQIEHTDQWEHPTSFHHRNQERPFHMDYVFVPMDWRLQDVRVGTFDEYVSARISDHLPVIVNVTP